MSTLVSITLHQGSSKTTKDFVKSSLNEFLKANPQIQCDVVNRGAKHPYVTGEYVNGYRKDISLRSESDILGMLMKLRNSGKTD